MDWKGTWKEMLGRRSFSKWGGLGYNGYVVIVVQKRVKGLNGEFPVCVRGGFILKLVNFVKKNYEIFVVNVIALGFIGITLLAQFGVHIRVDKGVELVPDKIGYSHLTEWINSKSVDVADCSVHLRYKDDARAPFWEPAAVVFGKVGVDDIKDMIEDGDSIKRNVFFNTRSGEVIGVTKSGTSVLSLYYFNSKMFRYGILITIIVDIFVGLLIKSANKKSKKTIDMNQYGYYPEDKKKLQLNEILFKMRNFRALYIFAFLIWLVFGSIYSFAILLILMKGATAAGWVAGGIVILILCMLPWGIVILIKHKARNKDEKDKIIENANTYLSNVGEDFIEQLQADLNKGLPFMKKHNLTISNSYVIGSMTGASFNPIAIPKEQIREIAYVYYSRATFRTRYVEQDIYFRLKNGKEIKLPVNDRDNLGLTLRALEDCGAPIKDITQIKYVI